MLINILLFAGIAFVLYSRLKRIFKQIILGSFLYTGSLINSRYLTGMFGFGLDHSTDVILTHVIMAPFLVMMLGWICLAIFEGADEGNEN